MSKAVMQHALEALENLQPIIGNGLLNERQLAFVDPHLDVAITALRAALAEPQITHSADCYKWHHKCAIARIEELREELKAALAEQAQPLTDACTKLLQEALPHAEWQDKHIHPVGRETYQNWKVTVYLPVPLSEADKSPQAALARAVEAEVLKRMGVGK